MRWCGLYMFVGCGRVCECVLHVRPIFCGVQAENIYRGSSRARLYNKKIYAGKCNHFIYIKRTSREQRYKQIFHFIFWIAWLNGFCLYPLSVLFTTNLGCVAIINATWDELWVMVVLKRVEHVKVCYLISDRKFE